MDAVSGQVLYEKNADVMRPPASTTKIMTAILLLENSKPTDIIVADKRASDTGGSSLNLKTGERVTAKDMLYALMLRSANDGCVAVAERIAGSEQKFAELMTRKAHEIGATRTQFKNCNGLNCPTHLTTARDLATMARYASRYEAFNEATRTKLYKIGRDPNNKDTLLKNHAKFLWKFPGADGIKTGWTVPAGHCFVGGATWNGWRVISVVMNSPDIVAETSQLIKYGFQRFQAIDLANKGQVITSIPVLQGNEPNVQASARDAIRYVVQKGFQPSVVLKPQFGPVQAPIRSGMTVGVLEAWADGKLVGNTPLIAAANVERAAQAVVGGSLLGRYTFFLGGGLALLIGLKYGTAVAKTARLRRYRLKAIMRGADRRG